MQIINRKFSGPFWMLLLVLAILGGCQPEGFINKVKYRGETVINTCTSFQADVQKLIESNSRPELLSISKQDNSDLPYYHLEPGQFEIKGDSLYFRLRNDLDFPQYLEKGVAVIVNLSAMNDPSLEAWKQAERQQIGKLVVDRKYYVLNRRPFFTYRFPLKGKSLIGKRLSLSFGIAQYNNDGSLKKAFCESQQNAFGPLEPACCTAGRWEGTHLQSIVQIPPLEAQPDTFVYGGFDATFDVTFQEGVFNYPDSLLAVSLQSFIEKYARLQYEVSEISLRGFASPLGSASRNERLATRRAEAVAQSLQRLNASRKVRIRAEGEGEDWLKVEELLTRSEAFEPDQKADMLEIVQADLSPDEREARLRRLSYWKQIREELFAPARHTAVSLTFAYTGPQKPLTAYPDPLPLNSRKTAEVAQTQIRLRPYQAGVDAEAEMEKLDQALRFKANANLYALRATYHLAAQNYHKAYEDLKTAQEFDPENAVYDRIILGYKIKFFQEASPEAIVELYNEMDKRAQNSPKDRSLFFNRAVLLEKMGLLERALREYALLFEGEQPRATQINNRGVARLKANLIREAESDFLQAIDRNETLAEPHFNLAALYAYRGLTSRSMAYLDKAIDRNPRYQKLIFNNPVFAIVSEDPKYDKYR